MTADEAKRDLDAQIKAAIAKFQEKGKSCSDGLPGQVAKACRRVENTAKRYMTNTATDNGISYGKRHHHPSLPGLAPAVDNGTLRRSITHDVEQNGNVATGNVGSIITNPPYGAYLENGTATIEPRPWLVPALNANREKIMQDFRGTVDLTINEPEEPEEA